jgi:hypothetical protein
MLDQPYVIVGGRVYVPRPSETSAAVVARACLDSVAPATGREERAS